MLFEIAFFFSDPPVKPLVPVGLRAPELILAGDVNKTLDIWSYGCLVFELVTGQPLFCVPWDESKTVEDDDHLLQLNDLLGALPEELYRNWATASRYFTPERKLFNCNVEEAGDGEEREPLMIEQKSMEEMFDEAKPDLNAEEAGKVKVLIRRILHYDPAQRPSAVELLRDPWFCDDESEGGLSDLVGASVN